MDLFPRAVSLSVVSFLIAVILLCLLYIYAEIRRRRAASAKARHHHIKRHPANPVISPRPHQEWEAQGTFNPAAVEDDHGGVHLLYRAIGDDGLSTIGHASSRDGANIDERSSFPVYRPSSEERLSPDRRLGYPTEYNPTLYYSGGGWGGHEDPRAVKIDGRIYMTYTAFQGWDSVRIALTSIDAADLRKKRWNWRKPKLISPPGEVHKNWVLFPEKIRGKFAILHAVSPKVLIDFVDNIDDPHPLHRIKSKPPGGGRPGYWDNWMRGAGAPPLRTDIGWLLLYHAMDRSDPNKYKLGAMILDFDDPTRILYRSPGPILSPEACYENDGKPGVVYASGALIRDGQLNVYYGGGDRHTCVAQTPIKELLDWLVAYGTHTGREVVA